MEQAHRPILALAGQVIAGYQLERVLTSSAGDVLYVGKRVEKKSAPIARPGLPALPLPEQALIELIPLQERRSERVAKLQQAMPALQRLANPGLLPLLRCGEDQASGSVYVIYPYPAGGTLADRLSAAKGKPLSYAEATTMLTRVSEALDAAHQQSYFHLHLMPGMILLDTKGAAYLASIGVAQALAMTSAIANGSLYAAPEQIIHDPILPTTDVYSLGMVLYQVVTGHTAFESTRHQLQTPPPPSQYRSDLPAQIETVILRAVASYPNERYATAGFLAHEFALTVQTTQMQSNAKGIAGAESTRGIPGTMGSTDSENEPTLPLAPGPVTATAVAVEALETADSTPTVPPPAIRRPANSQSFRVVTPESRGNTLYPPQPQPQWQLPADLAQPQAPTQVMPPAMVAASREKTREKTKSQRTRRKRRSWGIGAVSGMIALVSLAIVVVLLFPQLNGKITLPVSLPALPGQGGGSTSGTSGPISSAVGANLYKTTTPGSCDKGGAAWTQNTEAVQTCGANALSLNAPACTDCPLAVVALSTIASGKAYPANYVAEVAVQPLATDPAIMFGLKFRQQSQLDEGQGRGGYGYLMSQSGKWEFDKYAADGTKQILAQGKLSTALPANATLGLVVNGSSYSFYVNGKRIATEHDATYGSGYLCLAAAPGATIYFSKFSLSQVA